jgi:hypothetical protein
MIVFNHNIIFEDEPTLHDTIIDNTLPLIYVKEVKNLPFIKEPSIDNPWIEMSLQNVRYHRWESKEDTDTSFSWALEVKDMFTLIWDTKKHIIHYKKEKNATTKKLQFWVYHTFLPLVFELEKTYRILHVGAVEIDGKPIAFSALSFGGKSTLTDYFIQQGHSMLSDDTVGIEKRGDDYYAIASYPFHRPYRETESLGYPVKNFASTPKPLHAIFLLEKADPLADVSIIALHGIEKFKAFHNSAFIFFDFTKQDRFFFFSKMSQQIPVYKIIIPWDLKRLHEVYSAIVTWTKHNAIKL